MTTPSGPTVMPVSAVVGPMSRPGREGPPPVRLTRRPRGSELLRRAREGHDRFERGEGQERDGGDEHPAELPVRMGGDRDGEHADGREAGDEPYQCSSEAGDCGVASRMAGEAPISLADRRQPVFLTAIEHQLGRSAQHLDQIRSHRSTLEGLSVARRP